MKKYLLKQTLHIKDKVLEAGEVMPKSAFPTKSFKWLLEQEIIVEVTPKVQAEILEAQVKGEEE